MRRFVNANAGALKPLFDAPSAPETLGHRNTDPAAAALLQPGLAGSLSAPTFVSGKSKNADEENVYPPCRRFVVRDGIDQASAVRSAASLARASCVRGNATCCRAPP